MQSALDYANQHKDTFRNQLHDLLRIPSVSTDAAHKTDLMQAAEWVAQNMRDAGLENVEVMPTDGHPVVYGNWLHAGADAPTVLIYGHYDVQPAEMADGWDNAPFDPVERDGKIYARGASDDKGQMFIHIKAVEAILESEGALPVNVKFLIEGEEEIGSPNLPKFIETHKGKLKSDVCVISDTGMRTIDQPWIVQSLRGLVAMDLTVTGPAQDQHSGAVGGAVHNPAQAVAEIVAKLHDENGTVTVPGFYDNVRTLSTEERDQFEATAISDDDWLKATGAPAVWGEREYTIGERIGARPTLEINGIASGFSGEGVKTVLPARALAKITCRLVADQDPHRIFEHVRDYIAEITPPTVRSEVKLSTGVGYPVLIETDSPAMQAAIRAYENGWGAKPVFYRGGGTLPILADIQHHLDIPIILMGYGLTSDGAHGPNEHFVIEMFHKGIDTAIHYLYEVAQAK